MAAASDSASVASEEDDAPKDYVSPNADVFSYFTLTLPSERKKHGHITVDAITSYVLVFVVLFFQGTLLFCVSDKVIRKNLDWQAGVMNTGKDWNIIGSRGDGCNDGKSLCSFVNGTYTCAPPSVQLIGRWDELDTNKDGVWTRDEVMRSRAALKCKYAVDPLEVFDVFTQLLKEREKFIWLHADVKSGTSIPKVYFTYIMGDVAMCGYRNGDMCGNLLRSGFFDAALKHGTVPRVGTTIKSALNYCHDLLDQGGHCERMLPSTYSTWKIESVEECRGPDFSQFVYEDPNSGQVKSLLAVDYNARIRYEVAQTPVFKTYKAIIIFLWILLMVSQAREVGRTIGWVLQMRAATQEELDEEAAEAATAKTLARTRSGLRNDEIQSIPTCHRIALAVVNFLRICMLAVLLYVGLAFLGRQTDYIGLLMDGVALIFIVEVEEIVYNRVLRRDVRISWEEREPIELKKVGLPALTRRADITDLIWFLLVGVMAISFLMYYTKALVEPLYDALQCACLSRGDMCHEAHVFSHKFWNQYWKHDVPSSIEAINQLMSGLPLNDIKAKFHAIASPMHEGGSVHFAGRVAANLLQSHLHP